MIRFETFHGINNHVSFSDMKPFCVFDITRILNG